MLISVPSGSFHQAFPGFRCRNAFVQALRVSAPGCTKEQYNTEGLAKLLLFLTVVVLKMPRWQGNRRDASNDPASRRCAHLQSSDQFKPAPCLVGALTGDRSWAPRSWE